MIFEPFLYKPGVEVRTDEYTVPENYIECLARVVREYTPDTLDQTDTTIPLAIRMSALNPLRGDVHKVRHAYLPNETRSYLPHASAIIPATDGAFWLVFPFCADLDVGENTANSAVWYFPKGATGFEDAIRVGTSTMGNSWLQTWPKEFEEFEGDKPVSTAPAQTLADNHPCGATYTNVRLKVTLDGTAREKLGKSVPLDRVEDVNAFLSRFGPWSEGERGVYVDALLCCGGYFWVKDGPEFRFQPSNTLRIYIPSTTFTQDISLGDDVIRQSHSDESKFLTETIVIPEWNEFRGGPYCIGSTIQGLKGGNSLVIVAGGLCLPNTYDPINPVERSWAIRGTNAKYDEWPAHGMSVFARVEVKELRYEGHVYRRQYRVYGGVAGVDHYSASTTAMPLGPYASDVTDQFCKNRAIVMYPRIHDFGGVVLMYGGEFYGIGAPPDAPNVKYPAEGAVRGLSHLLSIITDTDVTKARPNVANVPLISCHVAQIDICSGAGKERLVWLPMNISGGHGVDEGAVAIPSNDERRLLLVGGATTEYTACVGGVVFPITPKTIRNPKWAEFRHQTCPKYTFEAIKTVPLYSRSVKPKTATPLLPYSLGIDTLRYDCLHSHAVRLGTSDFFVLPTSVLKYEYPPDNSYHTNATLVRTREPMAWNDDRLLEMKSLIERQVNVACNMYVSEVVGMPVIHEGPEKFSEETPYWYGHANPAKGSIGSVTATEGKEYWIYYLGNGNEPAKYYHIEIVTAAKSLLPWDGAMGSTIMDAPANDIKFSTTLPKPYEWSTGAKTQ